MSARQNAGHRPPDRQEELHKRTRSLVCALWKCLLVQLNVILALLMSIKLFKSIEVQVRYCTERGDGEVDIALSAAYNIVDINSSPSSQLHFCVE